MDIFFQSWTQIGRTLALGVMGYIALVFFLRISGKRTLSKMNAFDLVITVAFGSALATIMLSSQTNLAQGAMAFAVLVLLQFVVTWFSVRFPAFLNVVKAQPTLLLYRGEFLESVLRRTRVAKEEIRAAMRQSGVGDVRDVEAVVLETDGSFSIVKSSGDGTAVLGDTTLQDVSRQIDRHANAGRS